MTIPFPKLLGLWLLMSVSLCEGAYITDKLVAGLYQEARVSDKPIKVLNSGTPLEVISRENGFVKVRTSGGTVGWVEATYLTDEKPARSILLDTQAKVSMLQKKLEQFSATAETPPASGQAAEASAWQEKLEKAQGRISQLEAELQDARLKLEKLLKSEQQLADLQTRSELLETEKQALQEQVRRVAEILDLQSGATSQSQAGISASTQKKVAEVFSNNWIWGLFVAGAFLGFAGGFYYMRHKVNQRFGSSFRL